MQTFLDPYDKDFPLCTTAHWSWHSVPIPGGLDAKNFRYEMFDTYGRLVPYATSSRDQKPLFDWLRENPHRLHLGRIGFDLPNPDDVKNIEQTLDLWSGTLVSKFEIGGVPVRVQTCCHATRDLLAVRVESPLIAQQKLKIVIAFPYGTHNVNMAVWDAPTKHQTTAAIAKNRVDFARVLDADRYSATLAWDGEADFSQRGTHEFTLSGHGERLSFTCEFAGGAIAPETINADEVQRLSANQWEKFWTDGAAIDLGDCTDPRAGTGTADRPLAIQHRPALCRQSPLGRDRIALQQLARKVSPGDALVA